MRDIAREAGMLPGSMHYRFATKESLLVALMKQGMDAAWEAVSAAVAGESAPRRRIHAAAREHLRQLLAGDDGVYVLVYEQRSLTGRARRRVVRERDRYEDLWKELLAAAVASGDVRPDVDLSLLRLQLLGAMNWAAQWYSRAGSAPGEIAQAFVDNLLDGVGAQSASIRSVLT